MLGAVAVLRDLTREVEIEKMKTEFLANISHELRTPITPIKGYSDLLRRSEVPREQQVDLPGRHPRLGRAAGAHRRDAGRLLRDGGRPAVAQQGGGRLRPDHRRAGGEVGAERPQPPVRADRVSSIPSVEVDRRLVPLAISELVDNAVKFSPNGGKVPLVGRATARTGRAAGNVRISVKDEGIGIDGEQLSKIGQNFVQADGSETRAYGGPRAWVWRTSAASSKATAAGWRWRSEPSKGSCFTLVFPAAS